MVMRVRFLVGVTAILASGGCSTMPPAQVGQTAGTIIGSAIAPGIGPPLGALAGMLVGLLVQGEVDKVTEKHERKTLSDQLSTGPSPGDQEPAPTQGTPTRVWVDETVENGRLMAGHFDVRYLP